MFKLVSAKTDLFPNLSIPQKQLKCYAVLTFLFCQQNSESVQNQEEVNCQLWTVRIYLWVLYIKLSWHNLLLLVRNEMPLLELQFNTQAADTQFVLSLWRFNKHRGSEQEKEYHLHNCQIWNTDFFIPPLCKKYGQPWKWRVKPTSQFSHWHWFTHIQK